MIASSIVLEVSQNITVSLSEPLLSSGRNWVRKRAHEQREHITPRIHDYSLKPPLRRKEQRGMRINHPPFTTFSLFVWCHKQPLMLSTISRISTNLWCMSNKATLMVDINLESIAFWQRVFSCVELGCCLFQASCSIFELEKGLLMHSESIITEADMLLLLLVASFTRATHE